MTEPAVRRESSGVHLTDIARDVVAIMAPQELELFAEVTTAWAAGEFGVGATVSAWRGGVIRSGLNPQLISLLICPILAGAIGQVVGTASDRGLRRLWHWRKRRPELAISAAVLAQAEAVRAAAFVEAIAAGVSEPRAVQIGDAVFASLVRAAADSDQ